MSSMVVIVKSMFNVPPEATCKQHQLVALIFTYVIFFFVQIPFSNSQKLSSYERNLCLSK